MIPLIIALSIIGTPHRTVVNTPYGLAVSLVVSTSLDATGVCYKWGGDDTCYTLSEPYCHDRVDRTDCVLPHHALQPTPSRVQMSAFATLTVQVDGTSTSQVSPTIPESNLSCVSSTFLGCPCNVLFTPVGTCP